jgi:hypothetical protein
MGVDERDTMAAVMDQSENKRKKIKYALIAFTLLATVLFLGIFLVFVMSIKDMN